MEPNRTHKTTRKNRRKYDEVFKAEVLAMIAGGQQASEVARRLGIGESLIYKWKKRANNTVGSAEALTQTIEVAKENALLRKELQRTITERDILRGAAPKKALSIAARTRSVGR